MSTRLERLLLMDGIIRSGNYPSAQTFVERFEVSKRTVLSDIEFLKERLHAPLAYSRSKRGYFYTDKNWSWATLPVPVTEKNSSDDQTHRPLQLSVSKALALTDPTTPHPRGLTLLHTLKGHMDEVFNVAWSPNGELLASCSRDWTVRVWNTTSGKQLYGLRGLTGMFRHVAWSPDGKWLASAGSYDGTVWVWDIATGKEQYVLRGHTGPVAGIAWSPDGKWLTSNGSDDKTVCTWDMATGKAQDALEGFTNVVRKEGLSPDGKWLATGSPDGTIQVRDSVTGKVEHSLEGYMDTVRNPSRVIPIWLTSNSSDDRAIKIWDIATGKMLYQMASPAYFVEDWSLHGTSKVTNHFNRLVHMAFEPGEQTNSAYLVEWSPDGKWLVSEPRNLSGTNTGVCIWRTDTWEFVTKLTGLTGSMHFNWHPTLPLLATAGKRKGDIAIWRLDLEHLLRALPIQTVHYTNAKVVLVGDSGVGKSGLGFVLSEQPFTVTESTHGRRVWNFDRQEVSLDDQLKETRETLLWDLAGQPGYRLIHQLHLNEVAVALVVFDAHSETDPFAGVRHWDRALRLAQRIQGSSALPLKKFLVAARTDRGGVGVSPERIQALMEELSFDGYFVTSAKEGWQISELRTAICQAIDWQTLPKVSSTVLFRQIKQFLLNEKQQAKRLISSVDDLYSTFIHAKEAPAETPELAAQFETCIGRVESAGLIKQLSFGKLVLLQPELLDAYASALVNVVKDEPDGLGSIAEEQVRTGDFRMPADERMKDVEQEKLLLIAMIEDLLRRELALREEGTLVFPSQSTKENPDLPDPEGKAVIFMFEGPVLNIYATLAVRLARSGLFKKQHLWKNAVTYTSILGSGTCGMYLHNIGEGRGDLTLFFDREASKETRRAFTEYVHLYLQRRALPDSFNMRYVLTCSKCNTVIPDNMIQLRKAWKPNADWIPCNVCEARISLVEQEKQGLAVSSPHTEEMDQIADIQREREAAQSTLQGKIAIGDFDVFLCHHGVDKPIVKQIGEQLKDWGILPWLDEWELRPGLPWQQLLESQIEQIKSAAVFVGKNGIGPWQQQEIAAFLRAFVKRGCPVIPVLLQDAPERPELPLFLEGITWVDFRVRDPNPLQRLVWGITGKRNIEQGIS